MPEYAARAARTAGQLARQAAHIERRLVAAATREQQQCAKAAESNSSSSTRGASNDARRSASARSSNDRAVGEDADEPYEPAVVQTAATERSEELAALEAQHVLTQNELAYASVPLLDESDVAEEPLQLTLEETFFLLFALQCLRLLTREGINVDAAAAWSLFRRLDSRFSEKYVAYHYHRSHGWYFADLCVFLLFCFSFVLFFFVLFFFCSVFLLS